MASQTSERKNDHLNLVMNQNVNFQEKTNGFEKYDFVHDAVTNVDLDAIDLSTNFFDKKISLPFMISSMTGGTEKATEINAKLAEVANKLNIPIGIGSQRQALENNAHHESYKIIRKNAAGVPVLANIGASEISNNFNMTHLEKIIDLVEADGLIVHLNPLQELLQKEGKPFFKNLTENLRKVTETITLPVIVKEVGAGISKKAAKTLLDCGVKGIDVAGAGGTSWAGIEVLRNGKIKSEFWDWGLPTAYCLRKVGKLKSKYNFTLIASGGINNGFEIAKALALGADVTASAKMLLKTLINEGIESVIDLITGWFETVKKIMFLTGAQTLDEFDKSRLILKKDLY